MTDITPNPLARISPVWPQCGHGADTESDRHNCPGRQVDPYHACLVHLSETDRAAYLADLEPGGDLDHRGTPLTGELLRELLTAVTDPATHRPRIGTARFDGAQIGGDAVFTRVTIDGDVRLDGATIGGDASFEGTRVSGTVSFHKAQVDRIAWFQHAQIGGDISFAESTIGGGVFHHAQVGGSTWFYAAAIKGTVSFHNLRIGEDAWFQNAQIDGGAGFSGTAISGSSRFDGATISGDLSFSEAHISGDASFDQMQVAGDAWFEQTEFDRDVKFDGARIGGDASFEQMQVAGDTWFYEARIDGNASFSQLQIGGDAWFDWAVIGGNAWFDGATIDGVAGFDEASFSGVASFKGATFGSVATFKEVTFGKTSFLGPLVCGKMLDLSEAVFGIAVTIEAATPGLACRRTQWASAAALRLRYAAVDFSDAVMEYPVTISAKSTPFVTDGKDVPENVLPDGMDTRVQVTSLSGVDAAHLMLTNIGLTSCQFAGTIHLDQLRLEGRCPLAAPPSGLRRRNWWPVRWTRRQLLAEEHHWRATCQTGRSGWKPASQGVPVRTPAELEPVYRQLRKAFEDGKNEPGAADFYYGEMEMRRHSSDAPWAVRTLIAAYWALSGYGLRASRAFGWLLVAMIATVLVMMLWGLPKDDPKQVSTGTLTGRHITLETGTSDPVNPAGAYQERLSTARFEKSLRTVINSVVFRSSGQDLTTVGTYTEMVARIGEPVLLGLAVFAIRNRVKR
ncbi:pentapeptide repeat-containing protein [Streptomyces tubercidicus]|uniref:pentapeptide repeat-containing protein n=1 Tax=Streptomyces tubercidicus TaxID=47759 RepID=UPI0037B6F079